MRKPVFWRLFALYLAAAAAFGAWRAGALWSGWPVWCLLLPPLACCGLQALDWWQRGGPVQGPGVMGPGALRRPGAGGRRPRRGSAGAGGGRAGVPPAAPPGRAGGRGAGGRWGGQSGAGRGIASAPETHRAGVTRPPRGAARAPPNPTLHRTAAESRLSVTPRLRSVAAGELVVRPQRTLMAADR